MGFGIKFNELNLDGLAPQKQKKSAGDFPNGFFIRT